jgi:RimJ/RimL family protein N-acetyltransferase
MLKIIKMNLQPILYNELINIRPINQTDFDALFAIASDKLLWEQHPNNDRYKKDIFEAFFNAAMESKGAFVIIDNSNKKIIGSSRYYEYNPANKSVVIGYTFIDRKLWGTNYNRSLKDLMINYAFKFVDIIHLHVGNTNYRSQKAVEKLGAVKVGEIQDATSSKINWIYELKK